MNQPPVKSTSRVLRSAPAVVVLLGLVALSGCPPFYTEDEPVKAKTTINKADPIVVFVEGMENPAEFEPIADEMAINLTRNLHAHNLAPVIDYRKMLDLRATESKIETMSVAAIGRRVGAKQVLYVNFKHAKVEIPPGHDIYTMDFDLRVSLVDVATGHTLWPPDSSGGYPLHPDMGMVRVEPEISLAGVRSQALQDLADQITRLFITYHPSDNPSED